MGDIFNARPVCRDSNIGLVGAFEPEQADTDAISCGNCAAGFFGEDRSEVIADRERKTAAEKEAARRLVNCVVCNREQKASYMTAYNNGLACTDCASLIVTISRDAAWTEEWLKNSNVSGGSSYKPSPEITNRAQAESDAARVTLARRQVKGDKLRAGTAPAPAEKKPCGDCGDLFRHKTSAYCTFCRWKHEGK